MKPSSYAILLPALLIAACSSITVTSRWLDPAWSGPPASNVLVVGIARSDTLRRLFEDTFTQDLTKAGIKATQSYSKIPPGDTSKAQLAELVRSSGMDAVLVTRVQRVEQRVQVTQSGPSYGGFYGWYGGAWASTPQITQYEVVTLETSVWDPRTEKLVWTVTTQGLATNNIPKATTELAETLIPELKADGVLR